MPFHPNTSHPFQSHRFSTKHLGALPTLAINRLLGYAAGAVVATFFPIFLYEYFNLSVTAVLLWFGITYLVRIPVQVIGAMIFSRTGLVPSMFVGIFGSILFYFAVYILDLGTPNDFWTYIMLGLATAGLTILGTFYWSPFHIDFAQFTKKGKRGRQLSVFYDVQRIVGVVAPAIGGFLVAMYSYSVIFLYAIGIKLLALIPLVFLPKTYVQYEFGFFQTFQKMFSKKFRYLTFSMMANGAENVVGLTIWPIFLFVVLDGRYLDVGLITAAIVIVGLILQYILGERIDKKGHVRRYLRWGTGVYALGWASKALVDTVVGVFAASSFHTFGSILLQTPLDTMLYEKAADSGHYIDEFTIIKETVLSFGRVGMILSLIAVTAWFSLPAAFIAAALVSLGINLLSRLHPIV